MNTEMPLLPSGHHWAAEGIAPEGQAFVCGGPETDVRMHNGFGWLFWCKHCEMWQWSAEQGAA